MSDFRNIPSDFNEEIYLKLNPDIKEEFENNSQLHYINHGFFENRKYKINIPDDFDEEKYLKINPDVKENYHDSGAHHYINHGFFEKRSYNNDFCDYYNYKDKDKPIKNFRVSVILPNYNNADFLHERLETIFRQIYVPFEVIIIDDASTDNSVNVIKNFMKKNGEFSCTLIENKVNKGSGYYNWLDGIKLAKGDLIWIAESDDYCDLNFLKEINKCFNNLSVSIAYSKTIFVDSNKNEVLSMEKYLNEKWNKSFVLSTISLVYEEFSYLNIIPNVSSCVFKKPDDKILDKILEMIEKDNYKLVIDWIFYLLVGKCGSIAYTVETNNYYRQHKESVSHKINKKQYIYEHGKIGEFILQNFNTNKCNIKKLFDKVLNHFIFEDDILTLMYEDFDIKYLNELHQTNLNSFKNILICNYTFSTGGGEIFPIFLANEIYNRNLNVFFLSKEREVTQPDIIKLLNKNICIFNDMTNIKKIIDDFKITHVNTHHLLCDHDIIQYKNNNNNNSLQHIVTDHGNYRYFYDTCKYIFSYIENTPTKFIYITENNKNNFLSIISNQNISLKKIPISIPDYIINGEEITRESLGLTNTNFVITVVSRSIKEKGWEEIIQVVLILNKINENNIYLLLVGDLNNTFSSNLVEKYKSNINIKFLGFQNQVKKIFAISDLGVLPSYYSFESTPIVIIECLFANKPFIATNIGDIKNMLYGKDGYAGSLIDLNNNFVNIDLFVNEIQKYISSTDFYNEKVRQIEYVLEKLNFNNMVNEYLQFFYE